MWAVLFHTNSIVVPTYLVINSLLFCFGIFWIHKRAKLYKLNQNAALDLCLVTMVGGFVGSRAFHVFFERPDFYYQYPIFVFRFWYGGFVFYGGFIVAFLFSYLLCLKNHWDFRAYADVFAPVLAIGYSVGRVGCLCAGCCFGRPTNLPWGIRFPPGVEAPAGVSLHPTQIYSSVWEFLVFLTLVILERRRVFRKGSGQLFGLWLALHAVGRGIVEQFRGDFRGEAPFNLSISTWLSLLAIGLGLYMVTSKRTHDASTSS